MNGIIELDALLKNMHPHLSDGEYAFCIIQSSDIDSISSVNPICIKWQIKYTRNHGKF